LFGVALVPVELYYQYVEHDLNNTKSSKIELFSSFFLAGCGFFAAYQVRELGSVAGQIAMLRTIKDRLKQVTRRLNGEVGDLKEQSDCLKDTYVSTKEENERLHTNVNSLDKLSYSLQDTSKALESENEWLEKNLLKMEDQNKDLDKTVADMKSKMERLRENLKQFDTFRVKLQEAASEGGQDFQELVQKSLENYAKMDCLVRNQETVFLHQLAADVEFYDQNEDMSPEEFERFLVRIPKRYKQVVDDTGITFELFDKNGDGKIDHQELKTLIDILVRASEANKNRRAKKKADKKRKKDKKALKKRNPENQANLNTAINNKI